MYKFRLYADFVYIWLHCVVENAAVSFNPRS